MGHKILGGLATLTFLGMLVLSVVFYKERTCFLDISFHLFYILKDGDFAIQNNRFGAFFTQLFPLLGSKLGFSLSAIAVAYSASFVILPFLVFLIIYVGLKNSRVAIAYLLFIVFMTTHTFYWIQSEFPQAISFLFIVIALLDNAAISNKMPAPNFWLAVSVLSFTVCFTHPLTLFPFSFFIAYYYIVYSEKRKIVASLALIYFSFFVIKSIFFKTEYDIQAIGKIKNLIILFPNYHNLISTKNFLRYLFFDYYFIILALIACIMLYFKKAKYKILALQFIFFIGYSLLVNVSYPDGAHQFYLENQYLTLSFLVAIPFAYDVFPAIKDSRLQYSILSLICAISLLRMSYAHQGYSNRLQWNREILRKTQNLPNRKLIIPGSKVPMDTLFMTWSSSYEFWLLSTIEEGVSRSIIIEEKENEFDWALPSNKAFISRWGIFEYPTLNKRYFVFSDTTGYVKMR